MFITQRHCETRDNTGEDVQQFGCSVELVGLMNKCEETFVDGLTNHFSAGHKFGVKLMKDVLQVVSFDGLFGVKELEEFLDELRRDIDLERSNFNGFIDNQLEEKLIDALEMWPSRFDLIFLLNTSFGELQI